MPAPSPEQRLFRLVRDAAVAVATLLVVGGVPGEAAKRQKRELRDTVPPPVLATLDVLTHAAGGVAVEGATVRAIRRIDDRNETYTGAASGAGATHFDALPSGEYWIVADAPNYARASSTVTLNGDARTRSLVLAEEHRVTAHVIDELGVVIPYAEVEVVSLGKGADPIPVGGRTGESGDAILAHLGAGPWDVAARAIGFEEVTVRNVRDEGTVNVALKRLGSLIVHVTREDGSLVQGAKVEVAGPSGPLRGSATNAVGDVEIRGLVAGAYCLRATSSDLVSPLEIGIDLARGEDKRVSLVLSEGRSLELHVETGEGADAKPVRGARVSLAEGGLSPFPLEGVTDERGALRLGPFGKGRATLSIQAEGFVARGPIAVVENDEKQRVVLGRAGTLVGRVVDARGFPVFGATLEVIGVAEDGTPIDDDPRRAVFRLSHFDSSLPRTAQRTPDPSPSTTAPLVHVGELGVVPGAPPPIPRAGLPLVVPAPPAAGVPLNEPWVTHGDGTFHLSPVSPGRLYALVRHPQFVETESAEVRLLPGGEATVDVVLQQGGRLEGRVVDARGDAVSSVHILATAARGGFERTTRVANDGTFAFSALPSRLTLTVVSNDSYEPLLREEVVIPERERREVTLTLPVARPSLDVRVKDDRGYPVEGAQVASLSLDPKIPLRTTAFSDRNGDARLRSVRGLPLRVEVTRDGFAPQTVRVDAAAGGLEVQLVQGEVVVGHVEDAVSGKAIVGAEIRAEANRVVAHARTNRSGAFSLSNLALGSLAIVAHAPGYAPSSLNVTVERSRNRAPRELPPLSMSAEGRVAGTVVDRDGRPVPRARVARDHAPTFVVAGGGAGEFATTDERGAFVLGELPPGDLTLEAYAADEGRGDLRGVHVSSGETTKDVVIRIDEAAPRTAATRPSASVAVTLGERVAEREVVVMSVAKGSEAERMGLIAGDIIEEVDGVRVTTIAEARARLDGAEGDEALVLVRHDKTSDTLRVGRERIRR